MDWGFLPWLLTIIEELLKCLASNSITKYLIKKRLPSVKNYCSRYIKSHLRDSEMDYKDEIISKVFETNALFELYRKASE